MKKILTVVGARPQFVKSAVVSRALRNSNTLEEVLVHTGQHFDQKMSELFFEELDIPEPKYNLGVSGLSHGAMTGRMLESLEEVFSKESPDAVLVYGDTNSTLAGALAARKMHLTVAHVEAGLRSFDMKMPEEVNRVLTDRVSDILYCPTEAAIKNLNAEGFEKFPAKVVNVGDVMYDAVLYFGGKTANVETQGLPKRFALCTIHRAENTDDPERLRSIFAGLDAIANEIEVILPIHPRTRPLLENLGIETKVQLIDPVGYIEMLSLISKSFLVLTDSGGLQKEAFFLKKYCITLRDTTEWVELVDGGFNSLVGANTERIVKAFHNAAFANLESSTRPYGNGNAGKLIVADLEAHLA